jgi:hypothetical protein
LITTGAIHLDLYVTGYRAIPTIGWLFLLQVIVAIGLGVGMLATPARRALTRRLVAAVGAGFALATLSGYLLSVWIGLFGFTEVRTTAGIVAGVVEIASLAVLAALAIGPPADTSAVTVPPGGAPATQLRFPRSSGAGDGRADLVLVRRSGRPVTRSTAQPSAQLPRSLCIFVMILPL